MAAGAGATISGSVRINGETVEPRFVRSLSGFVTQEDVLPETLTCFEHLMFHAELRIRGASWGSRRDRVLEVGTWWQRRGEGELEMKSGS